MLHTNTCSKSNTFPYFDLDIYRWTWDLLGWIICVWGHLFSSRFCFFFSLHQLLQCCAAGSLGQQPKARANKYHGNRHSHWQHNRRELTRWPLLITGGLERKEVKSADKGTKEGERVTGRERKRKRGTDKLTSIQHGGGGFWKRGRGGKQSLQRYLSSLGTGGGNRKSPNRRERSVGAGNIIPLNPPC